MEMDADMDGPAMDQAQYAYPPPEDGRKQLDLVFIQDCTGSQGSYITSATKNIEEISRAIFESGKLVYPDDLRLGLIAFRDHPPQDHTYITKNFGFTSDISIMHDNLKTLFASGGGDGPEAVTAALGEALDMDWRPHAAKMVVLIADAPPHGIGEYGDGFDDGSPDGKDPLGIARTMASRGIVLFFVACEPALSGYAFANDFYHAITQITSGLMLPLTTANLLAPAIVGSALENMDIERLIREVGMAVAERVHGNNESVDDVAKELHEKLLLRNESTKKVVIENIYRELPEATHNVQVWINAPNIAAAKPLLRKIKGTRFTDKYLSAKYQPSRAVSSPSPPPLSPVKRRTLNDTKVFGGGPAGTAPQSVFHTAVKANPFSLAGNKAAFGGMRGGTSRNIDDDDEEEEEEVKREASVFSSGAQSLELREDSITYDQARRIAMQSAWRTARV
ncbi:SubName: Full=Uncharacterized protein {ECO:0000313/EMBL:CCA69017.1} [Serendipita indica DSM 11827]|uniref:VWFA domain-containing protein n=1 Tax=Serendipita indica (strain DSM 11827) TaxID=1109443 RepID=G4TCH4_SERID|nr:SubName: Full=Uncharacterized protein {ECO:0000313/EMBL:CCA69017.1} [Serendipita indica DSM 11827]CCA69017.1 hypothetical protein PIIN_02876 [Serendipita indica DSM 11827]